MKRLLRCLLTGTLILACSLLFLTGCSNVVDVPSQHLSEPTKINLIAEPYLLDTPLVSRSISFENTTGAKGSGGTAENSLGVGRKGAACREIHIGESYELANIDGPGTIRHIWFTTHRNPLHYRGLIVRVYWDKQQHPSIECPLGDFMGFSNGQLAAYQSAVHCVSSGGGLNIFLPMPFTKHARITITNTGVTNKPIWLFWQIDYTLGDQHSQDVGRLHVLFRRENPTTLKQDFEILPLRQAKGRYLGTVIGIRHIHQGYGTGEGEVKIYLDGDRDFPTICGTGTEDYILQAWGMQNCSYLYAGYNGSLYRWHLPDPIFFKHDCRVTAQQICYNKDASPEGLMECTDDWSCAAFWYEPIPSAPLPDLPPLEVLITDLE